MRSKASSASAQLPLRPARIAGARPLRTSSDTRPRSGRAAAVSAVSRGAESSQYMSTPWQITTSYPSTGQRGRLVPGALDEGDPLSDRGGLGGQSAGEVS